MHSGIGIFELNLPATQILGMKQLLLYSIVFFSSLTATAQKVWFIYLQSEPARPFYVKVNDKIYNSSSSGYLIISRLQDSTYTLKIGFTGNAVPEQKYTLSVNRKDRGFLIKDFGEKGWGLFDMQSMTVIMAEQNMQGTNGKTKTGNDNVSGFTDILSKATDDPSLKEKQVESVVKKEEISIPPATNTDTVKEEKAPPVVKNKIEVINPEPVHSVDTTHSDKGSIVQAEENDSKAKLEEEPKVTTMPAEPSLVEKKESEQYQRSVIKRKSESSTTEGFGLVFTDEYGGAVPDTIRILIPNQKQVAKTDSLKDETVEEKRFLDISVMDSVKKEPEKTAVKNEGPKLIQKNNCPSLADENDFLKLRKRMAAETGDDKMIEEARKYLKTKCFSVLQIRNLGTLFLNDEGKYKFFDVSYAHVSDLENFHSLENDLKDTYYITRFRAMLR